MKASLASLVPSLVLLVMPATLRAETPGKGSQSDDESPQSEDLEVVESSASEPQMILVVLTDGTELRGELLDLSADIVHLRIGAGDVRLDRETIARIDFATDRDGSEAEETDELFEEEPLGEGESTENRTLGTRHRPSPPPNPFVWEDEFGQWTPETSLVYIRWGFAHFPYPVDAYGMTRLELSRSYEMGVHIGVGSIQPLRPWLITGWVAEMNVGVLSWWNTDRPFPRQDPDSRCDFGVGADGSCAGLSGGVLPVNLLGGARIAVATAPDPEDGTRRASLGILAQAGALFTFAHGENNLGGITFRAALELLALERMRRPRAVFGFSLLLGSQLSASNWGSSAGLFLQLGFMHGRVMGSMDTAGMAR